MIRKLKTLGVALVGVFALMAVGASAASAEPLFHSEESHTIYTGEALEPVKIGLGSVSGECSKATLEGTTSSSTVEEIPLVTTSLKECSSNFGAFSVDFNGCYPIPKITFFYIDVYIQCPANKQIELTFSTCTIDIPTQKVVKVSWFGALKPLKVIIMLWELAQIKYKKTGVFCAGGSGEAENGTLTGEVELEGENTEGEQIDIWAEE